MEPELSEAKIVRDLADAVCELICRRTIRALQRMTDCRLSGDDSGLANVWDEICAQVQSERSFAWESYDETVRALVTGAVDELTEYERDAVWLRTPQGEDWRADQDNQRNVKHPVLDDIVSFIVNERVYCQADSWSNTRIRKYLDSSYLD